MSYDCISKNCSKYYLDFHFIYIAIVCSIKLYKFMHLFIVFIIRNSNYLAVGGKSINIFLIKSHYMYNVKRGVGYILEQSWLSKATKANYSWVSAGKNGETQNINLTNTLNFVLAICSNGNWLEILSNDRLNADRFISSLESKKKWIDEHNSFGYNKILIFLNNLASHRKNKVI